MLDKLLNRYQDLSDHITVTKKDPDVYPTFAQQYTDETVTNNSLVVECGDKSRYIPYTDIYKVDSSTYYTTGSVSQSFDGEGQITSAIDYVVSEDLPQVYLLSGHGEQPLSDNFRSQLTRSNYELTEDFSLLNVDSIPEECDTLLINAPTGDISEEELSILRDYLQSGGKLAGFAARRSAEVGHPHTGLHVQQRGGRGGAWLLRVKDPGVVPRVAPGAKLRRNGERRGAKHRRYSVKIHALCKLLRRAAQPVDRDAARRGGGGIGIYFVKARPQQGTFPRGEILWKLHNGSLHK